MLLYACQHYVNSCMNIFIHKIFPMLIIYHTRATVATICTLSMIPAIVVELIENSQMMHVACDIDENYRYLLCYFDEWKSLCRHEKEMIHGAKGALLKQ